MTVPDFKTYYKDVVIKIIWYCQNNKYINQCNRIENLELGHHKKKANL